MNGIVCFVVANTACFGLFMCRCYVELGIATLLGAAQAPAFLRYQIM